MLLYLAIYETVMVLHSMSSNLSVSVLWEVAEKENVENFLLYVVSLLIMI
jgi:hypothetical protein